MKKDIEFQRNNPPTAGNTKYEVDFNAGYDFAMKQVLAIIPHWEAIHQEELSNYNSYAASEVEERWQNEIDKLVLGYEGTLETIETVAGKGDSSYKLITKVIEHLKALSID